MYPALRKTSRRIASVRSPLPRVQLHLEPLESRDCPSGVHLQLVSARPAPAPPPPTNDPYYGYLWGMDKISAPSAWKDFTKGSPTVVVASTDTGVDYTHPDLFMNIWINQGEIPQANKTAIKQILNLSTTDAITFWRLNDAAFKQYWGDTTIKDTDSNGRIDGRDLLVHWSNGDDADLNGYADDLIGWNFVTNTNNPMDDHGHGTHTAGTIGAMGGNGVGVVGVNWAVQIMPLKFITKEDTASLYDAAAAVTYAAANGATISSNSWGYYVSTASGSAEPGHAELVTAITNAGTLHGHLFVAAAGNDGINNDKPPAGYSGMVPASLDLPNVLSVMASDSGDRKPYWSNYGKTSVDLAAPGVDILSTWLGNNYYFASGTSMAAPHVAGTAALLLAEHPGMSYTDIRSAIENGVDEPVLTRKLGKKTVTEYPLLGLNANDGRLNAWKALSLAGGSDSTVTTTTTGTAATAATTGTGRGRAAALSVPAETPDVVSSALPALTARPIFFVSGAFQGPASSSIIVEVSSRFTPPPPHAAAAATPVPFAGVRAMDHFAVVPTSSVSAGLQIIMEEAAGPDHVLIPELRPVEHAEAVLEEPALQVEILAVALPPQTPAGELNSPAVTPEQPPAPASGRQPVADLHPRKAEEQKADEDGNLEAAILLLFAQNLAGCHDMKPRKQEDDEEEQPRDEENEDEPKS